MNSENSKRKKIKEDIWDISIYSDEEIIHNLLNMSNPTDRELEIKIWSSIQKYKSVPPTPENIRWINFYEQIYHRLFSFSEEDDDDDNDDDDNQKEGLQNQNQNQNQNQDDEDDDDETETTITETKTKSNYNENTNSNANNNPGDSSSTKLVTQLQYATGNINPLLKETITRTLTIDSQYRDNKNEPTTNFILNLTETIKNVVNVALYSIHIPFTWYTISQNYGSNYFFIKGTSPGNINELYKITIDPGNYTQVALATAVNTAIQQTATLYSDICFGTTNLQYNPYSSIMSFTFDIQNIFNQHFYSIEFPNNPLENYTGSTSLTDLSYINLRKTNIGSFLGLKYSKYEFDSIHSSKNIPDITSTYSGYVIATTTNTSRKLYPNNKIWIYQYKNTNQNTDLFNSSSTVISRYSLVIPTGSYSRDSLTNVVNNIIKQSTFINTNVSYFKKISITDTSFCYFDLNLEINRKTTINEQNLKTVVFIPDDSASTSWRVWIGPCFQFVPNYTSISINVTGSTDPLSTTKFFPFYQNEIYSEYPTLKTNYIIGSNTMMILNCINPYYDVSQNNYILPIAPSINSDGYLLDEYKLAILNSFNYPIPMSKLYQTPVPYAPDPKLLYFYTFKNSDLCGNYLKNISTGNYDLLIDSNVYVDGSLNIPVTNISGGAQNINTSFIYGTKFTIGCWIYSYGSTNAQEYIFSSRNGSDDAIYIRKLPTTPVQTIQFTIIPSSGLTNFYNITIESNVWTFICWSIDATGTTSNWTIYNNTAIGTASSRPIPSSLPKNILLGKDSIPGDNLNFKGRINNFFIYNDLLTNSQVLDIYSKGVSPNLTDYYYTIPTMQYYYDYNYSNLITLYSPPDNSNNIFNQTINQPFFIGNDSKAYFDFDMNIQFNQDTYTIDLSSSPLYTILNIGKNTGSGTGIINLIDLSSNNYQIDFSFNIGNGLYDMICDSLITIYTTQNTSYGNQNAPPFFVPMKNINNNINGNANFLYNNVSVLQEDINLSFTSYTDTILNTAPFSTLNITIDPNIQNGSYYNGSITFIIINSIITETNYSVSFFDPNASWSNNLFMIDNSYSYFIKNDPSLLLYFYTFNPSDVSGSDASGGRYLKNQANGNYDLLIDPNVSVDGTLNSTSNGSTIQNSFYLGVTYSIGCWFKAQSVSNHIIFNLSNDNTNDTNLYFYISFGNVYVRDALNSSKTNGSNNLIQAVSIDTWYHMVYVNAGSIWYVYINGVLIKTFTGKFPTYSLQRIYNTIGKGFTVQPLNFNGQIDNFFIYNDDLTASQILDIYSKGQVPSQSNYYYTVPIQYFETSYNLINYQVSNQSYSQISGSNVVADTSITIDNSNNTFYMKILPDIDLIQTDENNYTFIIPNATYTRNELVTVINGLFQANPQTANSSVSIKTINGNDFSYFYIYINKLFTSSDYSIVFYDNTNFQQCTIGKTSIGNASYDTTIGWILGFREYAEYELTNYITTSSTDSSSSSQLNNICTIIADTTCSTTLFNYFILTLDDFNQNHTNDGLVTITTTEKSIPLPSYANRSDFVCDPTSGAHLYTGITNPGSNNLTQNQIYSITEIMNNNVNAPTLYGNVPINNYSYGPFISDVLAVIPIKTAGVINGQTIIIDGGTLQTQNRKYFGPINLNRLKITLYDDRGHIINLNNSNWSFTLLVDQIYKKSSASS